MTSHFDQMDVNNAETTKAGNIFHMSHTVRCATDNPKADLL